MLGCSSIGVALADDCGGSVDAIDVAVVLGVSVVVVLGVVVAVALGVVVSVVFGLVIVVVFGVVAVFGVGVAVVFGILKVSIVVGGSFWKSFLVGVTAKIGGLPSHVLFRTGVCSTPRSFNDVRCTESFSVLNASNKLRFSGELFRVSIRSRVKMLLCMSFISQETSSGRLEDRTTLPLPSANWFTSKLFRDIPLPPTPRAPL